MTVATLLLLALPAMAAPEDEEQDRIGGELIFEIVKVLASTPHLDTEVRGTLGSSLEFSFLLLQRSRTKSSAEALARTVVLRIDAGGGESRTEAILSKGAEMLPLLRKIQPGDVRRLCAGAMGVACMSEGDVAREIADLSDALIHGRVIPN